MSSALPFDGRTRAGVSALDGRRATVLFLRKSVSISVELRRVELLETVVFPGAISVMLAVREEFESGRTLKVMRTGQIRRLLD